MTRKPSTTVAATPQEDLAVVRAMVQELEDYLLGDQVYRTLVIPTEHGQERVQSSGGDLLARLHKLHGQEALLSLDERIQLHELDRQVADITHRFHHQWRTLLVRELKARLNSLKWYLDEYESDRRSGRVNYPFKIRNRQRIAEIWKALQDDPPPNLAAEIAAVDKRLRAITVAAPFVWDDKVRSVYPQDEYWYLYVLPA